MSDNAIFLIEGGPALDLIQAHVAEKNELTAKIKELTAKIAAIEANEKGIVVNGTAKKFKMDIEGCRRLEHEEWQIIVLTHSLMRKQAAGQLISQRRNTQPD